MPTVRKIVLDPPANAAPETPVPPAPERAPRRQRRATADAAPKKALPPSATPSATAQYRAMEKVAKQFGITMRELRAAIVAYQAAADAPEEAPPSLTSDQVAALERDVVRPDAPTLASPDVPLLAAFVQVGGAQIRTEAITMVVEHATRVDVWVQGVPEPVVLTGGDLAAGRELALALAGDRATLWAQLQTAWANAHAVSEAVHSAGAQQELLDEAARQLAEAQDTIRAMGDQIAGLELTLEERTTHERAEIRDLHAQIAALEGQVRAIRTEADAAIAQARQEAHAAEERFTAARDQALRLFGG